MQTHTDILTREGVRMGEDIHLFRLGLDDLGGCLDSHEKKCRETGFVAFGEPLQDLLRLGQLLSGTAVIAHVVMGKGKIE